MFEKIKSYKCIKFLSTLIIPENTVISIYTSQKIQKKKVPSLLSLSLPPFLPYTFIAEPFTLSLSLSLSLSHSLSLFSPYCALCLSFRVFHVTFFIFSYLSSSYFFSLLLSFFCNPCLSQLLLLRSLSTTRMLLSIISVSFLQLFFCHSVFQSISLKIFFLCLSFVFL